MLLVLVASALLAAVLFIAMPGAIYLGNATDFHHGFASYLPLLAGVAAVATVVIVLVGFVLRGRVRLAWGILLAFLALMAAIEAFFLLPSVGTLTGGTPNLEITPVRLMLEVAAAFAVAAYLIFMARRSRVLAAFLAGLAVLVSVPVLYSAVVEGKGEPPSVDENILFGMGDKNLLVVLLDGFPSDVFEEVIELHPEFGPLFSGFTYYPDTVGVAATTYLSLPSIHAAAHFRAGDPLRPYFQSAVGEGSFLSALDEAGYDSTLVNPILGVCPRHVYCAGTGPALGTNARAMSVARLLGVSLFRAAPLLLKEAAYDEGRWLLPPMIDDRHLSDHNVEGVEFLETFGEKVQKASAVPTAKFIHVLTPHLPVVLGEGCAYAGVIPAVRAAFVQQAYCALNAVAHVISSLKERDLYDSTAIVLLADHGQAIPSRKANVPGDWQSLSGWANPLLAVKPIGATGTGGLRSSDEPQWLPNVPAIICRSLGDCSIEAPEGDERVFNYYEWKNEFWQAETIPVQQYTLSGPPWIDTSWSEAAE